MTEKKTIIPLLKTRDRENKNCENYFHYYFFLIFNRLLLERGRESSRTFYASIRDRSPIITAILLFVLLWMYSLKRLWQVVGQVKEADLQKED